MKKVFFGVVIAIALLRGSWMFLRTPTANPVKNQAVIGTQAENVEPTPDPDPAIACNVHANCGGGTRLIKQSECNNSVCCGIGDDWIFYLSRNKCIIDQQAQTVVKETQIECWGPDGKSFITTQKECDEFRVAWGKSNNTTSNTQPSNTNTNNPQPYVYVPKEYFHCVLLDPWTGITYTYDYLYETEEECVAEQRRMTKQVDDFLDSLPPTSTPAPAIDYVRQCKADVNSYYSQQEINCIARFGMGSSAGPACIEITRQNWNAALGACN